MIVVGEAISVNSAAEANISLLNPVSRLHEVFRESPCVLAEWHAGAGGLFSLSQFSSPRHGVAEGLGWFPQLTSYKGRTLRNEGRN